LRKILPLLGFAAGAAILARLLGHADATATLRAVGSAGPLVGTAVVPFALGMTIDAYGAVILLRALGYRTTLWQMLPVRVASEALHISVPAGVVASDTATAALLETRCDVRLRDGVVVSLARRWLVMRAHALYIALGALAGFAALAALSHRLLGNAWLPWLVLASALIPWATSAAVGAGLLGRSTFARLHATAARVPSRRLGRWLATRRNEAAATDAQVAHLRASTAATAAAAAAFLGCWCSEALESALILRLVGASIPLASVFAIEAGLSLVRSAVVVAPSGLGVVDLGYATVLPVLGADPGAATAFVLLKRAKEVVWVLVGYLVLSPGPLRRAGAGARAFVQLVQQAWPAKQQ
jgi:uncharacterized membrane protein YbhN (UPF0104 family)